MTWISRPISTLSLVFALVWCLAPVMLSAQDVNSEELALPPGPVLVDLSDAVVRIVADDATEPRLRWRRIRSDEPGSADLSVTQNGSSIVIERPLSTNGETVARLLVEISMPTGQSVEVVGAQVDLSITHTQIEQPELTLDEAPPVESAAAATTKLRLVDSAAMVTGSSSVTGSFEDSIVELRQTTGAHELSSVDGELRIVAHTGRITVVVEGTDVTADGTSGRMTATLTGGSLDLRSTRGKFKIEAADSQVQFLNSQGPGVLVITDSNVDFRDARIKTLNLTSVGSYVTMTGCNSAATVKVTGGSLTVDGGTGALTGTVQKGASIELTEHQGDVKLGLNQDSSADLRQILGEVTLNARGAELTIEGAKSLTLTLVQSWASVTSIARLRSFQATGSEADLDLSDATDRTLALSVRADSRVRVRLAAPCRVQAKGLSASTASQIDVTGCELQLGQGGRWSTKNARNIDGQPPVTLTAQVAESAELTIEGRP